jgi:two-component system chemotaxis response regulator CheB
MSRIRVLVVDDSLTVRKRLCEVLAAAPGVEVVGEAGDGKEAIALCLSLRPDVVTLDMMLPVMTGLAATEYIMAHCPTPILIVSSSFNRGELFRTYDALSAGAVEAMEKPLADDDGEWERRFVSTVKLVARVGVITHLRARLPSKRAAAAQMESFVPAPRTAACEPRLVALGASTGGPHALVSVLQGLPENFSLPVVIVLHIGEAFGTAFADWLDGQTPHRVRLGEPGQPLDRPGVFLAPPGRHLVVQQRCLQWSDTPERFSCRPSVDVLFESLARECGASCAACLLTGMGQDGARGLLAIRQAGGLTIAQDEASSVVYGMPREAALLKAAERILPLHDIGPAVAAWSGPSRKASAT